MNIGELRELINDLPDGIPVMVKGGYFYCGDASGRVETISMSSSGETFKHDVAWLKEIDALDEVDEDELVDVLLFDDNE